MSDNARLTRTERNRRAAQDAPWQHALDRLRERHDAHAELKNLKWAAMHCAWIYAAHQAGQPSENGRVVTVEDPASYIIQVKYKGNWIRVVYSPPDAVIRTVLPGSYPGDES